MRLSRFLSLGLGLFSGVSCASGVVLVGMAYAMGVHLGGIQRDVIRRLWLATQDIKAEKATSSMCLLK